MSNAIYKIIIPALKYIQVLCSWLSFLLGFKASANPSGNPLKSNPIKFKQGWRNCFGNSFGNASAKPFTKAWRIPFANASFPTAIRWSVIFILVLIAKAIMKEAKYEC